MLLKAVQGAPFPFEVCIAPSNAGRHGWQLHLTGLDPADGSTLGRRLELAGREQGDYLDLFETIARAYGTRLPRNRRAEKPPPSTAPFRVLLDKTVSPDIWYGYGDPAVIRVPAAQTEAEGASYYLLATSNDAPDAFPILRSRTLADWELRGFVFPRGRKPSWAEDGLGCQRLLGCRDASGRRAVPGLLRGQAEGRLAGDRACEIISAGRAVRQ